MQSSMVMFTFSVFDSEIPFLGKFGLKNQNCQLELKFGTYTNLNMQNWTEMFTFFIFDQKYCFLGPKNQNYQFELKFGTWANSSMHNSMAMLTFCVFDQKYPFGTNLVQKLKIVCLRWSLVPTILAIIFWNFTML